MLNKQKEKKTLKPVNSIFCTSTYQRFLPTIIIWLDFVKSDQLIYNKIKVRFRL